MIRLRLDQHVIAKHQLDEGIILLLLHLARLIVDRHARDEGRRVEVALMVQHEDGATIIVHALRQNSESQRLRNTLTSLIIRIYDEICIDLCNVDIDQ